MPDDQEPVKNGQAKASALRFLRIEHIQTEAAILARIESVRLARSFGATWEEIAAVLGMTKAAAHKKYAHLTVPGDEEPSVDEP